MLQGIEAKPIRAGGISLRERFCEVRCGEPFVWNAHVALYNHRGSADHEPTRSRDLLLHKREIEKLIGKAAEKRLTHVPVRGYFKSGGVKVLVALTRGQNVREKRETVSPSEADREARAVVKPCGKSSR